MKTKILKKLAVKTAKNCIGLKLVAGVLLFAFLSTMVNVPALAADPGTTTIEGEVYYQLKTARDLYWFADQVNNQGQNAINAVLTQDIIVNSGKLDENSGTRNLNVWTPIGYYNSEDHCSFYRGTFDGQGHTINGLYFNNEERNYVGLFGLIKGVIKNVNVSNSYFKGGDYVGSVVGANRGGSIESCKSASEVNGRDDAGGIAGTSTGQIDKCINVGEVSCTGSKGGVVGWINGGSITNCYFLRNDNVNTNLSNERGCKAFPQMGDVNKIQKLLRENEVYQIGAPQDLYDFAYLVNNVKKKINAVLTNNIVVNSDGVMNNIGDRGENNNPGNITTNIWNPINSYKGDFNGQNYTISGLYLNDENRDDVGLFGSVVEGGVVRNVNVVRSCFRGKDKVGGVIGSNGNLSHRGGKVENCNNTGRIIGVNDVGGVVGGNRESEVKNCKNTGIISGENYVGGIIGGNNNGQVESCRNEEAVNGRDGVGGVVGGNNQGSIGNCNNRGKVSSVGNCVGGIVGGNNNGQVKNCKNEEEVNGNDKVGGVIGDVEGQGLVDECFNFGKITGQNEVGGVFGYNSGGSVVKNCYFLRNNNVNTNFSNGSGCKGFPQVGDVNKIQKLLNEKGTYQIGTSQDLYDFAHLVNNVDNKINAVLTNDVEVNNYAVMNNISSSGEDNNPQGSKAIVWIPIGYWNSQNDEMQYKGTFDGNGHTVKGLYFNDEEKSDVGLFGYVGKGGVVKNIKVEKSFFGGKNNVGGIVGKISRNNSYSNRDPNIVVENCNNKAIVRGIRKRVGGVVGWNRNGDVKHCKNENIVIGKDDVGGVVGKNNGTVDSCDNEGTVNGRRTCAGGIVGENGGTVSFCKNEGNVNGEKKVGGVVGENGGEVRDCRNTGLINGESEIGGIVGQNGYRFGCVENLWDGESRERLAFRRGAIKRCRNEGKVTGESNIGGLIGYHIAGLVGYCINEETVRGAVNVGAIIGFKEEEGSIQECTSVPGRGASIGGRPTLLMLEEDPRHQGFCEIL